MSSRIFIGLDYQATEADILDKFEQYGTVKEVFLPKDFRGRCKGYAFIEYENSEDCATALDRADHTQMFGRTVRLEPATGSVKSFNSSRGDERGERRLFDRRQGGERRPYFQKDDGERRDYRPREPRERGEYVPREPSEPQSREFSTLRTCAGIVAARRPVQLTQMNALAGRRMFGLAASVVFRRRLM